MRAASAIANIVFDIATSSRAPDRGDPPPASGQPIRKARIGRGIGKHGGFIATSILSVCESVTMTDGLTLRIGVFGEHRFCNYLPSGAASILAAFKQHGIRHGR